MAWAPFAAMAASQIVDKLWGKDKMEKVPTMSKQQQGLLNQIMQMLGGGGLGQGQQEAVDYQREMLDPSQESFQRFADPYMRQFQQETIPGLAERFAGLSPMGAGLSTSGFGQALSSAGGNLQSQLAQLKAGLGQQAAGQLMGQYGNMASLGLGQQPFGYQQQAPSMFGGFLQSWGKAGFPGAQNAWQNSGPIIGNV